jgi:NTP pyrophosphatase (non-canonical NTP hydrolase)
MTDIRNLIQTCANTTKRKGFDTSQHATQIALIATEVGEALECVSFPVNQATEDFCRNIIDQSAYFESYRKAIRRDAAPYTDNSTIFDQNHLNEELADIVIRVFSYVGGNDQTGPFVQALVDKIETNKGRPELHGKAF